MYVSAFKPVQCDGGVDRRVQGDGDQLHVMSPSSARTACALVSVCACVARACSSGSAERRRRALTGRSRAAPSTAPPRRGPSAALRQTGRRPGRRTRPPIAHASARLARSARSGAAPPECRLSASLASAGFWRSIASVYCVRSLVPIEKSPRARQTHPPAAPRRDFDHDAQRDPGRGQFGAHALAGILKLKQFGQRCDHGKHDGQVAPARRRGRVRAVGVPADRGGAAAGARRARQEGFSSTGRPGAAPACRRRCPAS